jgi:hypothetical protein
MKGMTMESQTLWYAVRTAGKFRQGQTYTQAQLGVLGRMAAKVGHLIPVEPQTKRVVSKAVDGTQRATRPRSVLRARRTKGAGDGEAGVSARSSAKLRKVPGAEVGTGDDGSGQPGGNS